MSNLLIFVSSSFKVKTIYQLKKNLVGFTLEVGLVNSAKTNVFTLKLKIDKSLFVYGVICFIKSIKNLP